MALSPSEEDVFAAIVADFEADSAWRQVRSRFALVSVVIAAAAVALLAPTWGWRAAAAFLASFSVGAAILFAKAGVLFRRRRLRRSPDDPR